MRRELGSEGANRCDGVQIGIDAANLEAILEEVHEIAATAATSIENAHSRRQPATQQLVEDVDIDMAELTHQIRHD